MSDTRVATGTVTIHVWDGTAGLMYLDAKDTCGFILAAATFRQSESVACLNAVYALQGQYPDSTVKFGK